MATSTLILLFWTIFRYACPHSTNTLVANQAVCDSMAAEVSCALPCVAFARDGSGVAAVAHAGVARGIAYAAWPFFQLGGHALAHMQPFMGGPVSRGVGRSLIE